MQGIDQLLCNDLLEVFNIAHGNKSRERGSQSCRIKITLCRLKTRFSRTGGRFEPLVIGPRDTPAFNQGFSPLKIGKRLFVFSFARPQANFLILIIELSNQLPHDDLVAFKSQELQQLT